ALTRLSYGPASRTIVPGCAGRGNSGARLVQDFAPVSCKFGSYGATIDAVPDSCQTDVPRAAAGTPFRAGTMVVVTLGNPREKFWGAILSLAAEGLSLCGVELASFDDLVAIVNEHEPFSPGVVFFPMHRVE